MTTPKYPRGWNEARVQRVLEYYESQTDEEVAAEIEAGLESTTMQVPRALVPVVRELIAKRKSSRTKKTHNTYEDSPCQETLMRTPPVKKQKSPTRR
jgi:hypothetical protein